MKLKNIRKIVFITLSNVGDAILTLPVLSALKDNFPDAKIDVVIGPRPKEVLAKDPRVGRIFTYDKHAGLREKIDFIRNLRREGYDLAVDMRTSLFPLLIGAKNRTGLVSIHKGAAKHKRAVHLEKLKSLGIGYRAQKNIYVDDRDRERIRSLLEENGIKEDDILIGLSPACRSRLKEWCAIGFIEVINSLLREGKYKILLIGDSREARVTKEIRDALRHEALIDLTGKTNLNELFALIERMQVLLTCDSASMHIACDLGVKVVAVFGPTDPEEYGPTGKDDIIIRTRLECSPCNKAVCRFKHECMQEIDPKEVLEAVSALAADRKKAEAISLRDQTSIQGSTSAGKRILIVRTDRIGDVVLSTPLITAARKAFPDAYIALMVSAETREIVAGNPYLNEVIVYDKRIKHKGIFQTLRFSMWLRQKGFDLALILHSTSRVNLISFLAGIPTRVGYARGKMDFLLTKRLEYTKRLGEQHETEYSLQVLRSLGVDAESSPLVVPVKKKDERDIDDLLQEAGLKEGGRIAVIHPGASHISKMWPQENFARLGDILSERFGVQIVLISSPEHVSIGKRVGDMMRTKPIFLCGRTSLGMLGALFKKTTLFISNDSGPVHIACAIGTPLISIFSRNEKGLSPARWGPLGTKAVAVHKDVGCTECLAHNCKKGFLCLTSITVEEIVLKASELLGG